MHQHLEDGRKGFKRIHHVIGAEGKHVFLVLFEVRTADNLDAGMQQFAGNGYFQIGVIRGCYGDDAVALGVPDTGIFELAGIRGVADDVGYILPHVVQPDFVQVVRILLDHNSPVMFLGQCGDHFVSRLAEAAYQVERLVQGFDIFFESRAGDRLFEVTILNQRQDLADGVKPGDDQYIDREYRPQALCLGQGVGDFAETDCGGCKADKVEGMEDAHMRGIAMFIEARDQNHTQNSDVVRADQ